MSGSKHFAKLAQKIIEDSDKGAKVREQRWRARQLMQKLKVDDQQSGESELSHEDMNKGAEKQSEGEHGKSKGKMAPVFVACACDVNCNFAVILANLSRVLWMAYEEYELLHACYTELFTETERPGPAKKVEAYWGTFVRNPRPSGPHHHARRVLARCQEERTAHLAAKAKMPVEPVAPIRRPLLARLLDPFGFVKCRCLRCKNLDAVMDYRVALFSLLAEYCSLFEDYARLLWCSTAKLSPSGREVTITASELDVRMLNLILAELYTAMSFSGENANIMRSLESVRNLIYR